MTTPGGGREPKYRRIADGLRREIEGGRYGPGDRLPGENELMAEHGVARMTVRQALGVLQAEGIVEARKGAGVFVREFRAIRRRGIARLAREQWGGGRSVWEGDVGERELDVEVVEVGRGPVRFREELRSRMPSGEEARELALGPGTPVTLICRTAYDADGSPVEVNEMVLDSAAYVLEYGFGA